MNHIAHNEDNAAHIKIAGVTTENTISDITDFPQDIFLLVISYLSPIESVLCRRVKRSWSAAFTSDDVSWNLMRWHFPRVREMRNSVRELDNISWSHIFANVARRYFYLRSAKPRIVESISQWQGDGFRPVGMWDRWLEWRGNISNLNLRDANWCLDDGLLIYRNEVNEYVAYDLETGSRFPVPFNNTGRVVRRLRLAHRILVIEWMEEKTTPLPYTTMPANRHFATAFDVQRLTASESTEAQGSWNMKRKFEWELHHDPLHFTDFFFSAHTETHYALYLWQEDGASAGQVVAERLTIWSFESGSQWQAQPKIIKKFSKNDLAFLCIRQSRRPMFQSIWLDEANVYVHEEAHSFLTGPRAPTPAPRNHYVRATGVPLTGIGPRWEDDCCADGDIHMSFCPRAGSAAHLDNNNRNCMYRFDKTWPGWAPCWRHEEFPYLTVSDVVDRQAGVRIVARQCFTMETLSSFVSPQMNTRTEAEEEHHEVRFADEMWRKLVWTCHIQGDERWVVGEDDHGDITIIRF
ncbi:hypothetical protein F5Y08DRAFT_305102 [Xylaria arbuscula]|nr:hypothetical protein F5Y08DRAFT_305102 [Xylaria arbuscula]